MSGGCLHFTYAKGFCKMADYILSCSSTVDLNNDYLKKRNIEYIGLTYSIDGKDYVDDMGATMPMSEFYAKMANGAMTKTSQVNVDAYLAYFGKFLSKGYDVVHVELSSGLSGSANSARIAADELKKDYPDRTVYVVDSLGASSGHGLLTAQMADLRDEGMSAEELYKWGVANRLRVHHWFFSTDLTYYVRGGRVSKAAGWFGTILKICPLLNMDNLGKLVPRFKIRGKNNVIKEIVKKMEENADDGVNYNGKCFISNAGCYEDAVAVRDLVAQRFPNIEGEIMINDIGTTIGSHTGPGTVALFFFGKERID